MNNIVTLNKNLIQHKLCETACKLFSEHSYDNVTMNDISNESGISHDILYKYFGNKQDIILFLYQSIHSDWEILISEIDAKSLHERFEKALKLKLKLIEPYSDVLKNIMGMLISNPTLSVTSQRTQSIRLQGIKLMDSLIEGSNDSKTLKNKIKNLPVILYLLHWGTIFLYLQNSKADKTISLFTKLLKFAGNVSFLVPLLPFIKELDEWAKELISEKYQAENDIASNILKIVFNNRKFVLSENQEADYEIGFTKHLARVEYFVRRNEPVHFILPAFPAKSPNTKKVLGEYPDLSEEVALVTLSNICKEIKAIYEPGAKLTICSDGRIFADLVGVNDQQVTKYVNEVKNMLTELNLTDIDIINLEDLLTELSFVDARKQVLEKFSEPLENLKARVKTSDEFKNLFNGIHRFITDDRLVLDPDKSKRQVKEESKEIALKVIQHSNAWTRFLSYYFPDSIRLSIHPHPLNSDKIGIKLTKATDDWITPWHGTIVLDKDGYILMKKTQAEEIGAKLILKNDKPYYFSLIEK